MKNRLHELRIKKRMSQTEMAKIMCVSQGTYSLWENDKVRIDNDSLQKLADFFGVSVDYLLGRDEFHPTNELPIENYFIRLPVFGSIRAGFGRSLVPEVTGDFEEVPPSTTRGYPKNELMVLIVKGDSMYPDFQDGDRVLIHRQDSVDSGDIAAIIYDGEDATIKKIRYESGQNWFEMIPRNPEFKTKRIEGVNLQDCRVIGKVIHLFRKI